MLVVWSNVILMKRLSLMSLLLAMVACSSNPNEHKPSPLPVLPVKAERVQLNKQHTLFVGKGLKVDEVAPHLATQNDKIYAASHDGMVMAVDVNAKKVWQQPTKQTITGGVSAAYGRVVVASANAEVILLDATTGQIQWRKTVLSPILAAPTQTAERIIVQSNDGKVYGLDTKTGDTVWVFDTPVAALSLRGYASPLVVGELVLVSNALGKIVALDAQTGIGQWETRVASPDGRSELERMVDIDGNMLLSAEKTLYVGSYQGQLIALDINAKPQVKWQQALSSYHALSESQSAVYAVDASSHVVAFDKQTGKVIWKQQDLAWRSLSGAITLDERLFVGDKDGYVHIIAQENGKLLGRFKVKGAVVDLAIFNQQLWVYTQKGQLSVWSLSK